MKQLTFVKIRSLILDRPSQVLNSAVIFILWATLVLPSAYLNRLFTLDLGVVFNASAAFPSNLQWMVSPYTASGRYVPLYWLFHALLFALFGVDVQGYYVSVSIVFLASALITAALFGTIVRSSVIGALFSVAIFVSSPNVESLYALGKAEPPAYLLIAGILALFYFGYDRDRALSIGRCTGIALAFASAVWFKETAIAMFALPLAGLSVDWLLRSKSASPGFRQTLRSRYLALLAALSCGFILSQLPYVLFTNQRGSATGYYLSFSLTKEIVIKNLIFYLTQQPDVTVFGIIAIILLFYVSKHIFGHACKSDEKTVYDLVFIIALSGFGWTYLSMFLFWRWPMPYYLFLPAILFRFAVGYGLQVVWSLGLLSRRMLVSLCGALVLSLIHAAFYLWYAAACQVSYSQIFTSALDEFVKRSPSGASLTFESYPFFAEQLETTRVLLNRNYHSHHPVYGIADLVDPAVITPAMRQLFSLTDADLANNEQNLPKKGDYVLAITGNELATWQVRGVAPYYGEGSFLLKDGAYEMREVSSQVVTFQSLFFHIWTNRIAFLPLSVGYKLYTVTSGPRFTWIGRYPDGWIGKRARLIVFPEYVERALIHVSAPRQNSGSRLMLFQDDRMVKQTMLVEGGEQTIDLDLGWRSRPTVFRLEVDRTFVPKKLGLNEDKRELGALVRLEPYATKGM